MKISKNQIIRFSVILARILVGATFIISGWAKVIDPWGTLYKIGEYLAVWGFDPSPEILLTAGVALSAAEFTIGCCLILGCLRRTTAWCALAVMAFMLPLTVYIAVANPVADCGCFGDLFVVSNSATLIKNILLAALVVILVCYNRRVTCIYLPSVQWIVITLSVAYALVLSFIGYQVQPLVDFRPYPVGTSFSSGSSEDETPALIYQRNGETREFSLENLPDSTWSFVGQAEREIPQAERRTLAVFDGDEDITDDILNADGYTLLLCVASPNNDFLYRSRFVNRMSDSLQARGGYFVAAVAARDQQLDKWAERSFPNFDVFSAGENPIKELVRGEPALVMIHNGTIVWKRALSSISDEDIESLPGEDGNPFPTIQDYNPAALFWKITGIYLLCLILTFIFNIPERWYRNRKKRKSVQKIEKTPQNSQDS